MGLCASNEMGDDAERSKSDRKTGEWLQAGCGWRDTGAKDA